MKRTILLKWSSLFLAVLWLSACGTSREASPAGDNQNLGYVKISKDDSTNGVGAWDRSSTIENPTLTVADMLQRVPGVRVQGSGRNARVTVHGIKTFHGNVEPLFVVDGLALGFGLGSVSFLNPMDIDHISVLKDSAASMYGVRGANGVIVIETKTVAENRQKQDRR